MPFEKKFAAVAGRSIAYIDEGEGEPIVLLHGNPTSSFLWRNVIPLLLDSGRVIVPDLIGQGDSEKLPASEGAHRYSLETAYRYVEGLITTIGADHKVTLVVHDWGSAIGFLWAMRHPSRTRGVAYMEAIVSPLAWSDWPASAVGIFQGFRSAKGEELILTRNLAPHVQAEDRQPLLNWPRQIPIAGEPEEVVALVEAYGAFMAGSDLPKLFINAEPGSILVGRQREFCRRWPHQREVTVKGLHFIQEDSPVEIGQAIAEWLTTC